MSPLVVIYAILYWIEEKITLFLKQNEKIYFNLTAVILIAIIIISAIFSLYTILFVKMCRKKLECIPIAVENIVPNDNWVIAVILSYALPAAGFVFGDINIYVSTAVVMFWVICLALSNVILPNPFLMMQRYHFYKITTVDGSSDICLLSKRRCIHNRNIVDKVVIAFNYLAIEENDTNV